MVRHSLLIILTLCCTACAAENPAKQADSATENVENPAADNAGPSDTADAPGPSPDLAVVAGTVASGAQHAAFGLRPHTLQTIQGWLRAGERQRVIAGLRYALSSFESTADRNAGNYILGRLLTDDLDPEGLTYIQALDVPFESFEDRRLLWLGRALALNDKHQEAVEAFDTLLRKFGSLDEKHVVRHERAVLLHTLGEQDQAREAMRKIAGSKAPRYLRAQAIRTQAEWTEGEEGKKALHKKLLTRFPTQKATLEPGLLVTVEDLSETERFKRAKELFDRWGYAESRDEFMRFVDHKTRGTDAAWYVGVISLRKLRDDAVLARDMLTRVFEAGGKHKEEALYFIFRSHMKQNNYKKALKVADKYESMYPKGEFAPLISYYRGWLPYDQHECEDAKPKLWKHVESHGYKRSVVLGFYAWCHVRTEDWRGAVNAFGKLAKRGSGAVTRGKAWYWQAYAHHQLGEDDKALALVAKLRSRYPLTYYDILGQQLAAVIEGRDPTASKLPWPEGGGEADEKFAVGAEAWSWPDVTGSTADDFVRVQRLTELGEVDAARSVWRGIRDKVEASVGKERKLLFIHFMSQQIEDYNRGWKEVTGALNMSGTPDGDDIRWVLGYPEAYKPLVERLGAEWNVPPHFVYGIMRQESRYRPRQISGADAVGALQMIPRTAEKIAADMGLEFDLRTFPRPEVGFLYSFYYFRMHFDVWQGQVVPTAASYNGGPQPIGRWIRKNEGAPMAVLIEEFEYNESRIYCRQVTSHMTRYLYLYESDPEARGRWLDAMYPVEFDYGIPDDVGY